MVLDDGSRLNNPEQPPAERRESSEDSDLASPVDRAAAVVADMLVFLPIVAVFVAPFRRYAIEAQLLGHDEAWLHSIGIAGVISVFSIILFQTICIALFGATPGKRFMGIKVVSVWDGRRPRPLEAFLRSILWCMDLIMVAPLAAIFGNEKRRPFHDRAADTIVINVHPKRRGFPPPTLPEMSVASGFQAAVMTVLTMVLAAQVLRPLSNSREELIESLEASGRLCKEVSEARAEWPAGPSRLSVAVSLLAADALDEDCLRQEAEFALWSNEEKPLAYLAKGLTESENEVQREKYLDKACAAKTNKDPICQTVSFLRALDKQGDVVDPADPEQKVDKTESENEIDAVVASLDDESPTYLKIWAIQHFMDTHRYPGALQLLDQILPQKKLGLFLARERAKALWQIGERAESRTALRTSIDLLGPANRMELSRWFCAQETAGGTCHEDAQFPCRVLAETVQHAPDLMAMPGVSATFVRAEICQHDGPINEQWANEIAEKIPEKTGKEFVHALAQLETNEKSEGLRVLRRLASDKDDEDPYFLEANLKLADLARSVNDLAPIRQRWAELSDRSDSWRGLGLKLVQRLGSLGAWNEALTLGLKILEPQNLDRQLYRLLIVSAYRAGNEQLALGFLERLAANDRRIGAIVEAADTRAPANVQQDEYDKVLSELVAKKGSAR